MQEKGIASAAQLLIPRSPHMQLELALQLVILRKQEVSDTTQADTLTMSTHVAAYLLLRACW
jgi:hypothetical protein